MHKAEHTPRKQSAVCQVVVLWIDWYAYHLARFEGLQSSFGYEGEVTGIEWVGGVGVHAGLKFREDRPGHLPISTLLPYDSWRTANKLTLAKRTWQRLSELDPLLVLVPGYYILPAIVAAVWARLHRRTSVLMAESTAFDHNRVAWKEALKSLAIRLLFDWAVVGGTDHREYLKQLKFPASKIASFYDVVGNEDMGVKTTTIRALAQASDYQLPHPYFLFVGRLAPEKNVIGLFEAWLLYRAEGGTSPIVFAGDGPDGPALQRMLKHSPFAENAYFLGHKTSHELTSVFSFASCLILPSLREPWGLVVNEAMAAGLPVIVSNRCGCAADLVESGQNGFTFDPTNPQELRACLHLMSNLSVEQRSGMSAISRSKIGPYSPKNFGREIFRIATSARSDIAGQQPTAERAA